MTGALQEFLKQAALLIVIVTSYGAYRFRTLTPSSNPIKQWFSENPWMVFLVSGIFLVPTTLLGRVKVGGNVNTLSFALYFILAAVTLVLQQALIKSFAQDQELADNEPENELVKVEELNKSDSIVTNGSMPKSISPRLIGILASILLVQIVVTYFPAWDYISYKLSQSANFFDNPRQRELEYTLKHPGKMYFPWNPLAGLMAEGKLYHFSYGLVDRDLAGFPITLEHFQEHLPSQLKYIATPPEDFVIKKYLPDFNRQVQIPELSTWLIYGK